MRVLLHQDVARRGRRGGGAGGDGARKGKSLGTDGTDAVASRGPRRRGRDEAGEEEQGCRRRDELHV